MEEKYIFIDCDGVILDSEQRMNKKRKKEVTLIIMMVKNLMIILNWLIQ